MKVFIFILFELMLHILAAPIIEQEVLDQLQVQPTTTVFISFTNSYTNSIRQNFSSTKHTFSSRESKLNVLYQLLKDHADSTQENVRSFLKVQKEKKYLEILQSWMTNELIVKGIDKETVATLGEMDDVKEIRADKTVYLYNPEESTFNSGDSMMEANQWGVSSVRAPEVWEMGYLGEGVIVATIDSGVRGTHEALKSNHRKENGWFDPLDGDEVPTDYNGHGTHTMGTIAGQKYGIGVAPLSKWIACKGCDLVCRHSDLIACGNFMGCPTDTSGENAKCHLAPHLVSNSWGGGGGGTFYDEIVSTWILVDIYPIFAAGNSGNNGCETVTYPGDHTDVITVGAIDKYHNRSEFSSLGPSVRDSGIKPDVSAPGSEIISSFNGSDDDYQQLQGTSRACPHVAGVAALLLSKIPYLPYPDAKKAIIKGAQPTLTSNDTCGGIPEHVYPNNHVGAGRVDAVKSINII